MFAVTYSNLMHVMGTSWTSNYDGPTNEQLRDPSNWSLAYCDPRLIPLVDLIVNVDVGCRLLPLPAADPKLGSQETRRGLWPLFLMCGLIVSTATQKVLPGSKTTP